jgi:hypothetical protein
VQVKETKENKFNYVDFVYNKLKENEVLVEEDGELVCSGELTYEKLMRNGGWNDYDNEITIRKRFLSAKIQAFCLVGMATEETLNTLGSTFNFTELENIVCEEIRKEWYRIRKWEV